MKAELLFQPLPRQAARRSTGRLRGQAEQLDEIINRYSAHLPNGAEIMPAKKSAAIAIEVPKIADPWQTPFRDYITEVEAALNAVTDLILTVQKAERPS